MSNSNAASSAQTLLDALIELRRLGPAGVFSDSGRFRAFMSDLRPGLKKEVRVLSALIDAGYLQRLQDAAEGEREIVSAQMKLWLDEELMLNAEKAQYFSSVLLAYFSGSAKVFLTGCPPVPNGSDAVLQVNESSNSPASGLPSPADEWFSKGSGFDNQGQGSAAAYWYRKAAGQGHAQAQFNLGLMYEYGNGVDRDLQQALYWYGLAAEQGHAQAREELARKSVSQASAQPVPKIAPQSVSYSAPKSAASSLRAVYANKRVGDRFEFGRYPQGKNGEVMPIVWRVLRRDSDALLVIAEQGLDCKPYNEDYCDITWADCSLRRWLNADFYNRAFNEQERVLILSARIANNAGPATEDRVFLLSVEEAECLFADDNDRMTVPTAYAVKNNAYTDDEYMIDGIGCCWWWLRSRGSLDSYAAFVYDDGGVLDGGYYVHYDIYAVRPAFKIAL